MVADARHDREQAFRAVAGQLVTGVAIVFALDEGEPFATTVGSVVAASWDPPLLAVFLAAGSRLDAALQRSGRFTVNVLGEADHALARRFARPDRRHGWAALGDVQLWRRDPAPPVLSRAAAWVDCAVTQAIPVGDHRCYVGEALAMDRDRSVTPLVYYRGRLRGLGPAVAPAGWSSLELAELASTW